jgi:DNA-directed RNA polymerase specialized sigma subunit
MNSKTFEELLVDENIKKIAHKASMRFINRLNEDEIQTCILNALWKSTLKYNEKLGSKFTTYFYKGVIMECLSQIKFNKSKFLQYHSNLKDKRRDGISIDLIEEIEKCDDPNLIIDKFIYNKSIKEIACEHGVSGETIRLKIKKNIKKLKKQLHKSV